MSTANPMTLPITNSHLNKTAIDKWILFFRVPDAMRQLVADQKTGKGHINTESVQMTIKSVSVPDIRVKAISKRYGADNLHISSHSRDAYELLSISFDVSNDFSNWATFYEWMNLILDEKEAIPDPYNKINSQNIFKSDSYWTNLGLLGCDEYNNVKIKFTFTQAFPTTVNGFKFDYSSKERITSGAAFAFSQLHVEYPTDLRLS